MEVCSVFFRFVLFLPQTMRPHATSYVVHWLRGPYTQSPHQQLCSTSAACRSGLVDAYSGKALDLISCACRATKCRRRRRHILELGGRSVREAVLILTESSLLEQRNAAGAQTYEQTSSSPWSGVVYAFTTHYPTYLPSRLGGTVFNQSKFD